MEQNSCNLEEQANAGFKNIIVKGISRKACLQAMMG